ncbi:G5 domain-containing protein [Candidatus Saccharibacteria bacterium]|nr:G5 domain-containing protein [Candidatus Saccharibacteria bacterium]
MKLSHRFDKALIILITATFILLFACVIKATTIRTYAAGDGNNTYEAEGDKYVTFYDDGDKLTVKTDAHTVGDALERADIVLSNGDKVEPTLDTIIDADNYHINIYRAHPVIVKDDTAEKYFMTASYDTATIAREAGLTIYDGDEIKKIPNNNFLESGAAEVYKVVRNGGRTLTVEEEIPFTEEIIKDTNLPSGTREVRNLGEVGTKKLYYNVYYIDNVEVSRELVNEEVIRPAIPRVVAEGAKSSIRPEQATCAAWAREAGVSEADLESAIALIYHESGCRPDAANAYSGAYGIPQALPGNKMASAGADWQTNPVTQIKWMSGYVSRYGGWQGAWAFWVAHHWY